MQSSNLITIFFTGLLTGGLTCMAVQGGFLAATMAQREEERLNEGLTKKGSVLPILSFLATKLIAYSLFGFLLGWFGSFFTLSLTTQIVMQGIVVTFMLGTACNILNVHPIFRYFSIQPPKFFTRAIRKRSKSSDIYAPAFLGAFTVFIPCGTTQAVMALSIASGHPITGALILFSFILGTSPVFFIFGYFTTKLGDILQQRFMKVTAFAIILLAIFNLNNAAKLAGSPVYLESIGNSFYCTIMTLCDAVNLSSGDPVKDATINIVSSGYSPNNLTMQAGSLVTIHLKNISGSGCQQAFTIPSLGLQKIVPVGSSDTIQFKTPDKPETIAFTCGMGMYPGQIMVEKKS